MPPPQKGKAPTKGSKQILVENTATVNFYRNMSLGACSLYAAVTAALYYESLTFWTIALNILIVIIYFGCYQMMVCFSKPSYTENGDLLDPGLDLNMEGGMGEHVKDIVILSSITHVLTLISSYFWFLLLLLPIRGAWLVWSSILGPWFFQQAEDPEQDEKKRKKMERKMKRYQQ